MAEDAAPAKAPAGATSQKEAPLAAQDPPGQGTQASALLAPGVALAVPAGQGRQAAKVCPSTLL